MRTKIAVALLLPMWAIALVLGVLHVTAHTTVPPLTLPNVPTRSYTTATGGTTSITSGPCFGDIPKHFAGLALKGGIGTQVTSFAQVTGHAPQVVEFYNPFKKPFANSQAQQVIKAGEIPLIQLNPKGVSLRGIAAGVYDRHIKQYAMAVRKFGCAIILSFGHEMNGWWYPWGAPFVSPSDFIAAWRHIHDVFAAEGVTNVIWSWDPSHQYSSVAAGKAATPASVWYPGKKYVDIIGIDGYLGYDSNGHPQNFREIFGFQLHDIKTIAPHKMVYIAETGVAPGPASTKQIIGLFKGVTAYGLAGLVWFDATGQPDSTGTPKEYQLQKKPTEAAVYKKQLSGFLR